MVETRGDGTMTLTPKERVGRGLDLLAVGMRPFVEQHMRASASGGDWVALLQARDEQRDGRPRVHSIDDPQFVLRVLTQEWRAFGQDLTRVMRAMAEELRQARNSWAHSASMSDDEAERALDTMERLLSAAGAARAGREVRDLRRMSTDADDAARDHGPGPAAPGRPPGHAPSPQDGAGTQDTPGTQHTDTDTEETGIPRHTVEPGVVVRARDRPALRPGHSRVTLESGPLDVDLVFSDAINYALVHNRISPLRSLTLRNLGERSIHLASLTISLESPQDEQFAEPLTLTDLHLEPGDRVEAPSAALALNPHPGPFARMSEAVTGEILLAATTPNGRYRADHPVLLLARDEWWATSGIPESLAAFVTPRDPAIADLLSDASTLLQERVGDPSLPGYQAGGERVLAMTEAIYDAMQARRIRYIDPPPSFEGTGQKIRPHREVLVNRWGTCLDLTCTFAAALEQAGLNPVIVSGAGHAFAGVLLEEVQLGEIALRDANILVNLAESGLLVAVETTAVTAREKAVSFAAARAATRRWFTADLAKIDNALDVRSAHRRVRPLPIVREEDGAVVVEVEGAPQAPLPLPRPRPAAPRAEGGPGVGERPTSARPMPARVAQWRNALLDLSFRNPLLNMRTGRSGLDLHVPAGSLGVFEDLVAGGTSFTLIPHDHLSAIHQEAGARTAQDIEPSQLHAVLTQERVLFAAATSAQCETRLRGLARRARTVLEETGANNLYLGLGTLRWSDAGREALAPLFLVPVTLRAKRGQSFQVQIEDGATAVPNQCLLEKLRVSKGLEIPYFQDPDTDASGIDLPGTLQEIRAALLRAGLPYRVEETAHLAIFQFSTLQLWQDLSESWESFLGNPVVRHLVETPTDSFADPVAEPEPDPHAEATAYLPVAVDGSQLEAVRWAAAGRSFVLEGPPGTGKSQTITNLIAHTLAEGKRVLFVAEKQAALDVVKRRLDSVGLGAFCLDVHGRAQTPAAVRDQLREALHAADGGNPATWEALRGTYRTLVAQLRRYPEALHAVGPAGLSAWTAREVILTMAPLAGVPGDGVGGEHDRAPRAGRDGAGSPAEPAGPPEDGLRVPREAVSSGADLALVYAAARDVADAVSGIAGPLAHQAWGLAGPQDVGRLDREAVLAAGRDLRAADAGVPPEVRAVTDLAQSPEQLDVIGSWLDLSRDGVALPPAEARAVVGEGWTAHADAARDALTRHRASYAPLIQTFRPEVLGADLDTLLAEAERADSRFFKGRPRRRVLEKLAPHLRDGATVPPAALVSTMQQLTVLRRASWDLGQYLAGVPGVRLPAGFTPLDDDAERRFAARLAGVHTSARLAHALPAADVPAAALVGVGTGPGAGRGGTAVRASGGTAVRSLAEAWRSWFRVLASTQDDVARWRDGRPLTAALRADSPAWDVAAKPGAFLDLTRWVTLQNHLAALTRAGLGAFSDGVRTGAVDSFTLEDRLRLGVAWAALEERLHATGLDRFDSRQRESTVGAFVRTGEDVRARLVAELPARIVAARSFDPNRLMGLAGELGRELSRQRGGLSIRRLLQRYGTVVGELTPCLLMSPHSVARFLAPGAIDVDLVVFDEASQIRVAESVGAMGRARSAVVVGDSKQMPPTTFGGGPGEDDGESERGDDLPAGVALADRESILSEAVDSKLPRLWLSWHYRSQDESLIAFSNRYYYDGRLASFPGPPGGRPGMGISWQRVAGEFERGGGRVNRVEAGAIVDEIRARLRDHAGTSIGVVTFNAEQRDLILDLLEASEDAAVLDALAATQDGLFVKNLENVQGDERDVILFSLAFSADRRTGKLPLNFGPLNRAGGERRLNVAITRAKRQVLLFSSFAPEDIELERTSSLGLAHLRDYLMLAARGTAGVRALKPTAITAVHRESVAAALEQAGLVVRRAIGLSDFTVDLAVAASEDGPWLAVLLDGPGWAGRRTVGDRDALPTALLQGAMGWPAVVHVWLPSWLAERDRVVARVVEAARAVARGPGGRGGGVQDDDAPVGWAGLPPPVAEPHLPPPPPPPPVVAAGPMRSALAGNPDARAEGVADDQIVQGPPFAAASTTGDADRSKLDRIADGRVAASVRRVALDVIAAEGPVEAGRLARIVGNRFGLQRVVAKRAAEILGVVPTDLRRSSRLGTFYWPAGTSPKTYRGFRPTPEGVSRPLAEIAPEEIANAMAFIARASHGIATEDLLRETAGVFGASRLTAQVRGRLEAVLARTVKDGRLRLADGVAHG